MIFSVKYENGFYVIQSEVTTEDGPLFEEFETDDVDEVLDYISEIVGALGSWEETFCFTDPIAHRGTFNGIVTGQCAEIMLPNKGLCNLCEVNLSALS